VADALAHPPDEVPSPLVHSDLEPALRRQPPEDAHPRGRGLSVLQAHAAPEPRDRLLVGLPADLHAIDARYRVAGVQDGGRQPAVVREEEEARRVHVEPADGVEPLAGRLDEGDHRRPALRVVDGAHDAARFVEHDRAAFRGGTDRLAVHGDRVARRVGPLAELAHDGAVHRDAPRADEVLGAAPRRHAGGAQDLLQPLGGRLLTFVGRAGW